MSKNFKEFINESVSVREEKSSTGAFKPNVNNKNYEHTIIEDSGKLKEGFNKGNFIYVTEFGKNKKPSKELLNKVKELEEDGWKLELMIHIGTKNQDWTGEIYKNGGCIKVTLSK